MWYFKVSKGRTQYLWAGPSTVPWATPYHEQMSDYVGYDWPERWTEV